MAQWTERKEGDGMDDETRRELEIIKRRLVQHDKRLDESEEFMELVGDEVGSAAGHLLKIQREINKWLTGKKKN